jgi:hypothetical protein
MSQLQGWTRTLGVGLDDEIFSLDEILWKIELARTKINKKIIRESLATTNDPHEHRKRSPLMK